MNDPIPLHIASFFLFCLAVVWTKSAWSELGYTRETVDINPARFLLTAFFSLIATVFLSADLGVEFLFLAVLIAYSGALSLIHPIPAISILTSYLIIRPWEIFPDSTGLTLMPRLFAFFALLSWVLFLLRRRSLRLVWNSSCTLLLLFTVWLVCTSIVNGALDNVSIVAQGFTPILTLFFLILNVPNKLRALDALVRSIIIAIAAVMAIAIYATVFSSLPEAGERLSGLGLMGNANDLAACIVFTLPFLLFSVQRRGFLSICKPNIFFFLSILLLALWLSQSRGALVAVAGMITVYLFADLRSSKGILFIGFVAASLTAFLLLGIEREVADLEVSRQSRIGYIIAGLRMFKANPVFGVGVFNYPIRYDEFAVVFFEFAQPTAHSSWILPLAEAGLPGLLLFGSFYGIAIWRSWGIRKKRPEFFYALIGYAVAISFLSHTYLLYPYLLAGLALCATRIIENEPENIEVSLPEVTV